MEAVVNPEARAWSGSSVFVTGHTGFKGGWLTMWLHRLGAAVHGLALEPPTTPSFFEIARVSSLLTSDTRADVAHPDGLRDAIRSVEPIAIFHLAAQPLVKDSYQDPLGTLMTNVIGTARLLEAAREIPSVRAIVVVTTDKVYARSAGAHTESDSLGGDDPYSGSKAAAEIIAGAYRASFFSGPRGHSAGLATVRAGNVIGGGDWAADRLVPDCLRAFERGLPATLRNPRSIRPWQHVLEPLCGYLLIAEKLLSGRGEGYARAWNFGPGPGGEAAVSEVASLTARAWGSGAHIEIGEPHHHAEEAETVRLDASLARREIGWSPRWSLWETIDRTVDWHRAWTDGRDMLDVTLSQIDAYEAAARG